MLIWALKDGHDGAIAALEDGRLLFSLEAEKDSFPRYDRLTSNLIMAAASRTEKVPDVLATSGWVKGWHSAERKAGAGYFGSDKSAVETQRTRFMGREIDFFSSSHERSHILCGYGLSPWPQGQPCYCLVWEGNLGDFYHIDEHLNVRHLTRVMSDPGNKYGYLFMLADPQFPNLPGHFRFGDAGKLMALTGFAEPGPMNGKEKELIDYLLSREGILLGTPKDELQWSPYYNIGVESQAFKNLSKKYSDEIFSVFHRYAEEHLTEKLPLIITGGCGLNCDWNSAWWDSGLFSDVFVPPCANDSGSAIGTAIDAQFRYTGNAKVEWNVYAGDPFVEDVEPEGARYDIYRLDYQQVAQFLENGHVIGWVQGDCEMGPRALGNRSILAAPFSNESCERLNAIKKRERYRPVAPACLEEEAPQWFDGRLPSPHMLYFARVKTDRLAAVTHVDGSARVQTVSDRDNPPFAALLRAFGDRTGFSVLCNTSLNFNGRGFINRTSDLLEYGEANGLDGYVVHDRFFVRRKD